MGGGGGDGQPLFLGQPADERPLAQQLLFGFGGGGADRRAEFHHRLVQLRFDLPLHDHHLAVFDELGDERTQFAALRIDNLILLLDAKCQLGACNHFNPLIVSRFQFLVLGEPLRIASAVTEN